MGTHRTKRVPGLLWLFVYPECPSSDYRIKEGVGRFKKLINSVHRIFRTSTLPYLGLLKYRDPLEGSAVDMADR